MGYDSSVHSCPYHGVLTSTINGVGVIYLYDKNGNLIKEVFDDGSFREYNYGVLDLPYEIADYDSNKNQINLTKFIYGLGGQRIGKIGRVVDMTETRDGERLSWDLNEDGSIDAEDAKLIIENIFNEASRGGYKFFDAVGVVKEWRGSGGTDKVSQPASSITPDVLVDPVYDF